MSIQMRGAEVAKAMKEKLIREREELNAAHQQTTHKRKALMIR